MSDNKIISERQDKNKKLIIEQLKTTPIVEIACKRVGIGRASYYRWRQESEDFASKADQALLEGSALVNDMAESQLISAIKEKNMTAIIFWLKTHHKLYTNKVELSGKVEIENKPLTVEQEALVKKALQLAGLAPEEQTYEQNK